MAQDDTSRAELAGSTWPEVPSSVLLVVPVGSVEQHGPHLPLDTDTRIATAVARTLPAAMLAPALAYGASGEHEGFAGTVSLGVPVLQQVLVEYGRSACRWAARLLFVNGHGGNATALSTAVAQLRYEGRDVAWWPCAPRGGGVDAHAGVSETSLLLHLDPGCVRLDRAEAGNRTPIADLLPRLRESSVLALSPNGVLGDPAGATAADGLRMFAALVSDLRAAVDGWQTGPDGRLRRG